ncbi:MAG: CPP1-like family protein [Leptolyngbya sp.]|nr:CPP1-like family protein [Leptolyngbya sp.]
MSEQNSYDTLGLDESSSFDEIQAARERLLEECEGDRKQMESIEAAYDAILMERLRLRQEGKIKVPDRIRFAEEATEAPAPKAKPTLPERPDWLTGVIDTPERNEILLPGAVFLGLLVLGVLLAPSIALALGVMATLYFVNRKERRFWRSLLWTVGGLVVGMTFGVFLGQTLASQGMAIAGNPDATIQAVASAMTLVVFWVVSSFLR